MQKLTNHIRSGIAGIQILTSEEDRAVATINETAKKELANSSRPGGYSIWTWTVTKGLRSENGEMVKMLVKKPIPNTNPVQFSDHLEHDTLERTKDPVIALNAIMASNIGTRAIIVLKDFHMHLGSNNPMLIRLLKEAIDFGKKTNRHLIILGCESKIPPELEKEIVVIELPLPTRAELEKALDTLCETPSLKIPSIKMNGDREHIVNSMMGMTMNQASDAAILSMTEHKKIVPSFIHEIKTETIKRHSVMEIINDNVSMDEIGGLRKFKNHISSISNLFTAEAREYGVPQPQSILAVGNPGTGKSMSAMAIKTAFKMQLLRLEAGRLFGSYVGESERNWRNAMATAVALAPCIFWIDEAEGLFSGMQSSGKCDGGTTSRIVKGLLQDMQMNSNGIFFVFTSNDIDGFPDPLIDRCDVWAFDLPNKDERKSIWSIHISKRKRKPKEFDLEALAERTEGFSGRQIEQAWIKAMTVAFNDKKREPVTKDALIILDQFIPTSVTMKQQIERRRERLKNRAQSAS